MESKIVIKVKYGETLRRYIAPTGEDGKLDLDITKLREKIDSLFGFSPDRLFSLSYVDEDGDIVALVDEDDLQDVMLQALNPLRITVESFSKTGYQFSGTRFRSPQPDLQSISNVIKSIPEPLRESISKLSQEVVSKAASTGQLISGLVDSLSKLGQSLNAESSRNEIPTQKSETKKTTDAIDTQNVNSGINGSMNVNDDAPGVSGLVDSVSELRQSSDSDSSRNEIPTQKSEIKKATNAIGSQNANSGTNGSTNVNDESPGVSGLGYSVSELGQSLNAESSRNDIPTQKPESKKTTNAINTQNANSGTKGSMNVNDNAPDVSGPSGCNSKPTKPTISVSTKPKFHTENNSTISDADSSEAAKFTSYPGFNALTKCTFSGTGFFDPGLITDYKFSGANYTNVSYKDTHCEECRMFPLTTPYYKSKSRVNYYICRLCFVAFAKEDDYIIVDHVPSSFPYPTFRRMDVHEQIKNDVPMLDSRFVMDINILDGTVLAPRTPFTKIWRMKNTGTVSWPKRTKLVWIGGDRFSSENTVEAQHIANGLAVKGEINIAVDFCAPEVGGRFVSYWRLSTPTGQKFGQRVWVIIEVDAALTEPENFSYNCLNLNLPPVDSEATEMDDINMIIRHQNKEPEAEVCGTWNPVAPKWNNSIYNPPLVAGYSAPIAKSRRLVISKAETTPSFSESPLTPSTAFAAAPTTTTKQTLYNDDTSEFEMSLLMELRAMGFKKMNLTKELLRRNNHDLQKAVDELCGFGEWDPIIDLQEIARK